MDFFKSYVKNVVDLVNNLAETSDLESENSDKKTSTESEHVVLETAAESATKKSSSSPYFNWVPNLLTPNGESGLLYYMNSLASVGSNLKEEVDQNKEQKVCKSTIVTDDISKVSVPQNVENNPSEVPEGLSEIANTTESSWINDISSHTSEVWKQIKHDFNEVVTAVSEPKDVVFRTASSVRDHISAAAKVVKNLDANDFLLPEAVQDALGKEEKISEDGDFDSSNFSGLKSDVSQLVNTFRSGLLSTGAFLGLISAENDESVQKTDRNRRDARLNILRADPATYEHEPPSPPPSSGLHSFNEWRAAYFDENECRPLLGIPLPDARDPKYSHLPAEELTQPPHPSPSELLDSYPFMRTYLTQLVNPDGEKTENSISDADFWSRYYYRVWLLDSTEFRRRRFAERVASVSAHTFINKEQDTWSSSLNDNEIIMSDSNREWLEPENDGDGDNGSPFELSHQQELLKLETIDEPKISTIENPPVTESSIQSDELTITEINNTSDYSGHDKKKKKKKIAKKSQSITNGNNQCDQHSRINNRMETFVKENNVTTKSAVSENILLSMDNSNTNNVLSDFEEATSGSSSVVILSNTCEQDDDFLNVNTVKSSSNRVTITGTSKLQFQNKVNNPSLISDGWGESDEEKSEENDIDENASKNSHSDLVESLISSINPPEEVDKKAYVDTETEDWENWS